MLQFGGGAIEAYILVLVIWGYAVCVQAIVWKTCFCQRMLMMLQKGPP